jgi:hypothetical protein
MVVHMLNKLLMTLIASTGLFIASAAAQGVPDLMPYQGFLHDADGAPVSGNVSVTFKLYEEQLANTPVWEETVDNIIVSNGAFSVELGGITVGLKDYLYTGRAQYIGLSINNGPELSPRTRLGALPYAYLSYNATKLEGLNATDFVTETELSTFADNFQGGLSADDVNTLIDDRGYLNTAAINALIDARNYINSDEIDRRINDAITAVNVNVGTLQTDLTDLQTTVQNLQDQLNNLVNQGQSAHILGASVTATNGWIQFNNQQGVRAAGEMCKSSYPNEPTAHYCSLSEVQEALSVNQYNPNINGVPTWVYSTATPSDDNSYCQSLLYFSGHGAVGTSLTISTESNSVSGGNGIRLSYDTTEACSNSRNVLCCR